MLLSKQHPKQHSIATRTRFQRLHDPVLFIASKFTVPSRKSTHLMVSNGMTFEDKLGKILFKKRKSQMSTCNQENEFASEILTEHGNRRLFKFFTY